MKAKIIHISGQTFLEDHHIMAIEFISTLIVQKI